MPSFISLPRGRKLELGARPLVMGIINRTPDSFFSGSRRDSEAQAVDAAAAMIEDGADILDIGGESTRPGSAYVSEDEELERVVPAVVAIRSRFGTPISVDTRKSPVAREALRAGADMVNDVSAAEDSPDMLEVSRETGAALVLMHKLGTPERMQEAPSYADVVGEVCAYLMRRAEAALAAGIAPEAIVLDPGIGFGKRFEDNIDLINRLAEIRAAGYPVLVGLSRKGFLGEITGRPIDERLVATVTADLIACARGADIIRVHDVRAAVDSMRVREAFLKRERGYRGLAATPQQFL